MPASERTIEIRQRMAELLEDVVLDASAGVHRPRNLDWKRAARSALRRLGNEQGIRDWSGICRRGIFIAPDHSCGLRRDRSRRHQLHRHLSSFSRWRRCLFMRRVRRDVCWPWSGRFCCVADLTVTAALSGWSALSYITSGAEQDRLDQDAARPHRAHNGRRVVGDGLDQLFRTETFRQSRCRAGGADGSGSYRFDLLSVPHLTTHFSSRVHQSLSTVWVQFVGVILALSGRGIDRESYRRDEARSGIDDGTPERRA